MQAYNQRWQGKRKEVGTQSPHLTTLIEPTFLWLDKGTLDNAPLFLQLVIFQAVMIEYDWPLQALAAQQLAETVSRMRQQQNWKRAQAVHPNDQFSSVQYLTTELTAIKMCARVYIHIAWWILLCNVRAVKHKWTHTRQSIIVEQYFFQWFILPNCW